ncbi:MAG: YceI family protein [Miltoncostaeaceae bacterium]
MSTSVTPVTSTIPAGLWAIDPGHSTVGFSVKHMGIATVRGEFREFEGALEVGEDGRASVRASVQAASVDTREEQRDEHLRSPDFFDAAQHPVLTLASTSVALMDEETIEVSGDLTINGATNPVTLQGDILGLDTDPWGNERVGIELRGQLSRGDYGMRFNQALGSGNMLVGDKVKIAIDLSLVRGAAE